MPEQLFEVFVFDKDGEFKNRFSLRNKSKGRKLALKSNDKHTEVLVLESGETGMYDKVAVYRYETECAFDHRFCGMRRILSAQLMVVFWCWMDALNLKRRAAFAYSTQGNGTRVRLMYLPSLLA